LRYKIARSRYKIGSNPEDIELAMKLSWTIEPADVRRLRELHKRLGRHPFVLRRRARNIDHSEACKFSRAEVWRVHLGCLLTTQQRSGAGSAVERILDSKPFALSLRNCRAAPSCEDHVRVTLTGWGGIRRADTIGRAAAANLAWLEAEGWPAVSSIIAELSGGAKKARERSAARYLAEHLSGIGPKQSRNMLQWLGVTRFEIPIDSRVIRWLNEFGFPIRLSGSGLGDPVYYEFVLDGVQRLCSAAQLYPCLLDAMIFAQNEPDDWSGE
jgi:hypothetical protein